MLSGDPGSIGYQCDWYELSIFPRGRSILGEQDSFKTSRHLYIQRDMKGIDFAVSDLIDCCPHALELLLIWKIRKKTS